ncbi:MULTISPECIES: cation diffusion facilitator family transporter [Streptomyces]|uniref:cation diffusion facilitator family transporter n=1 Tax=Streptomyces TaxID=1883 RepID=UPI000F7A84BE|nr:MULTISPECIES: cation diffusion facilitator family transporter [unclassified Streptomyces]AJZ84329.1 cation diffusion facilitator family transporter [Streptomyces sp. AgN23]RSS36955.1 cation diffusion facilitator family transporter [Streptomyces sp. WAC05858]
MSRSSTPPSDRHEAPRPPQTPDRPEPSRTPDSRPERDGPQAQGGQDARTAVTVFVALGANLVIALAKAVGGVFAGSPALLSEAAHSVADSLNEVFLLASLKRSKRAPDEQHPFGYGKERYFWALLAAVGIFVMGGCFSVFQGAEALSTGSSEDHTGYLVGLGVLGLALIAEGSSLVRALFQVRGHAREAGRGMAAELRRGDDPTLRTVLAEDSTACLGVVFALLGMWLHMVTGEVAYEATASFLIGALLVYVAYRLARESRGQLIGEAIDPVQRRELRRFLEGQPEIDTVTSLLTMRLGNDSTLVAARVDLFPGLDSEEVEEVLVRVKTAMAEIWPHADQIFLDVTDASARDRAKAREDRQALDETVAAVEREDRGA